MPKILKGGDTPTLHGDDAGTDASQQRSVAVDGLDGARPGMGGAVGCLVLVLDARLAARDALAAQVALLLPGARPASGIGGDAVVGGASAGPFCQSGPSGPAVSFGPAARLVVRSAGEGIPIPPAWEGVPVAEVRPRDVDGDGADVVPRGRAGARREADPAGRVELADVALALARCGQLRQVAVPEASSGPGLSGSALAAGVPEVMRPLLPGVQRTADALVGQAEAALAAGDQALLARVGHTLRGMAANYAMPELAACSAALERSAHGGDVDAAADALAWLRAAVAALTSVIAMPGDAGIQERE
jgi:HPt (histidine-containing phosphotransfer) domain-containing protein